MRSSTGATASSTERATRSRWRDSDGNSSKPAWARQRSPSSNDRSATRWSWRSRRRPQLRSRISRPCWTTSMVEARLAPGSGAATLTLANAVNAALDRALAEFPEALLFGEDIAIPGGVFGCTKGLVERHGTRVFDTPISESAILGAALGAALMGRRPIVEIMWVDFTLVAFDQIVNHAPTLRYVSHGRLHAPM